MVGEERPEHRSGLLDCSRASDRPPDGEVRIDPARPDSIQALGLAARQHQGLDTVEVIGFVSDTSFNGQGGLWASEATWRTTLSENRPDAQLADGVWQALVVRGATKSGISRMPHGVRGSFPNSSGSWPSIRFSA